MKMTLQLELLCGNNGWPEFDVNSPIIEKKVILIGILESF